MAVVQFASLDLWSVRWYCGFYVSVNDQVKKTLLSIAQDIFYLTFKGKPSTPKYLALGMAVRHLAGSSIINSLLNGLGHSSSASAILQYDTALALKTIDNTNGLPSGFQPTVFTTLVWDNNDFGEETLSGKGTTHVVSGIIIQRINDDEFPYDDQGTQVSISRKRKLYVPPAEIVNYFGKKKKDPTEEFSNLELNTKIFSDIQDDACKLNQGFTLIRHNTEANRDDGLLLPGWTGFIVYIYTEIKYQQWIKLDICLELVQIQQRWTQSTLTCIDLYNNRWSTSPRKYCPRHGSGNIVKPNRFVGKIQWWKKDWSWE